MVDVFMGEGEITLDVQSPVYWEMRELWRPGVLASLTHDFIVDGLIGEIADRGNSMNPYLYIFIPSIEISVFYQSLRSATTKAD